MLASTLAVVISVPGAEGIAEDNPYAIDASLPIEDVVARLDRLRRKPESIRLRPGFAEALFAAVDRVLDSGPQDAQLVVAVLARLEMLHDLSIEGDADADRQIRETLEHFGDTAQLAASRDFRFFVLEQAALSCAEVPDEPASLLEQLEQHFAGGRPRKRDLRLASTTVRIINQLPEDDAAEQAYQRFGDLFAKSLYRRLRMYGKQIAKGTKPPSFVGQQFQLTGQTLDGEAFDLESLRGKIVLVDFWATWCPPCRAALPGLQQVYGKYHEKGFDIVGVSLDDDIRSLEQFVSDHEIDWVNLVDEEASESMAKRYNVTAIPKTFLIGPDGVVLAEDIHAEALSGQLEKLLE